MAGIITLMLTIISVGAAVGGLTYTAIRKLNGEMKELRGEIGSVRDGLRSEMQGLREDLRGEILGVRDELRKEIRGVRDELRGEIVEVRNELRAAEGRLTDRVARLEDKVFRVPLQDPAADPT
ncbi:hypothetical protein [Candidatus Palauibacter sp.]|uniref:hypothetical protein n=1 Tax=Candidatus Palauibacter sp. TaxID=3101350 RepID=UPI003B01DB1D